VARLSRSFFARSAPEVAPDLLGQVLVRRLASGTTLRARIVETEAYEPDDPASHSYRGPTRRNASMFGGPGHLYVYFTYGMHWCMNVVTGPEGHGSAVLLRAGEPLDGIEAMMTRRGTDRVRDLCRGPARLAQAFDVDGDQDGADLIRGKDLWLEAGRQVPASRVVVGPRVGISDGVDLPWRFVEGDSPWASSGPWRAATPRGRGPGRPSP
jgi:DNA-3-methyladenine glycosylase